MKVTITVPDEVHEKYSSYLRPGDTLESHLAKVLLANHDRDPKDRTIVITSETRSQLEAILHGGHLRDEADLLAKVSRLSSIEIGHVRLNPSPAQMEELKRRAEKNGRDPQREAEGVFAKMSVMFFKTMYGVD